MKNVNLTASTTVKVTKDCYIVDYRGKRVMYNLLEDDICSVICDFISDFGQDGLAKAIVHPCSKTTGYLVFYINKEGKIITDIYSTITNECYTLTKSNTFEKIVRKQTKIVEQKLLEIKNKTEMLRKKGTI